MKYLTTIFYLFITCVNGQSVDKGLIEMQIINDSLQTFASSPELTISLRCKNNRNKNLLLYGFEGNITKFGATVERACDQERVGGGIALLILNEKREREHATWSIPDSIDYKPMPKEKFEQRMGQGRLEYLRGTKILKGSDVMYVDQKIDLREFSFKKGTYYLQIIYYSGKKLKTKTVGEEQIEKDKKAYNAELYQGCVISNEITFRVD